MLLVGIGLLVLTGIFLASFPQYDFTSSEKRRAETAVKRGDLFYVNTFLSEEINPADGSTSWNLIARVLRYTDSRKHHEVLVELVRRARTFEGRSGPKNRYSLKNAAERYQDLQNDPEARRWAEANLKVIVDQKIDINNGGVEKLLFSVRAGQNDDFVRSLLVKIRDRHLPDTPISLKASDSAYSAYLSRIFRKSTSIDRPVTDPFIKRARDYRSAQKKEKERQEQAKLAEAARKEAARQAAARRAAQPAYPGGFRPGDLVYLCMKSGNHVPATVIRNPSGSQMEVRPNRDFYVGSIFAPKNYYRNNDYYFARHIFASGRSGCR